MGFRQRLADFIRGGEPQNASGGVEFSAELIAALEGRSARAIELNKAIETTTVLRCAVIKAEGICSIPFKLYKKGERGREEAREHPLWDVLHTSPNEWQTSFEFRKTIGLHLALCGNAYVWLNRVRGRIVEMIPFEPGQVRVCRNNDWTIEYRLTFPDGTQLVVPQKDMWHLKNHSWDSYKGLSALDYAARAIGLARDIETGQSDTHKHVARPSGVLSISSDMDAEQFKQTRKLIDAQVSTRLSKGLPMVVDKTMTWTQMAMKAIDTQTIETRGFQIEEIARAMGVLPIALGYSGDKSMTYASAEQMFIHHFTHTTRPDHRNFEQSADKWLLTKRDRAEGYYTGLVDQELLRGDTKARGEFYRLLWMIGAVTGNEIRGFEDMNELEGLDRPWAPLANAPIGEDGMPMVADRADSIDNQLRALLNGAGMNEAPSGSDIAKLVAEAYDKASPMAQHQFLSHLRGAITPDKGSE